MNKKFYKIKNLFKFEKIINTFDSINYIVIKVKENYYLYDLKTNKIKQIFFNYKCLSISVFKEHKNILEFKANKIYFYFLNKISLKEVKFNWKEKENISNFKEFNDFFVISINFEYINVYNNRYKLIYHKIQLFKTIVNYNLILKNNIYKIYFDEKELFSNKFFLELVNSIKYLFIKVNKDYYKIFDKETNLLINLNYEKITDIKEYKSFLLIKINYQLFKILDKNKNLKEIKFKIENITNWIEFNNLIFFEINYNEYKIYKYNNDIKKINEIIIKNKIISFKEKNKYFVLIFKNNLQKIYNKNYFKEIILKFDFMERITDFKEYHKIIIIKVNHKYYKFFEENKFYKELKFENKIIDINIINNYLILKNNLKNYLIFNKSKQLFKHKEFIEFQFFDENFLLKDKNKIYFIFNNKKDINTIKKVRNIININKYHLKLQTNNNQILYYIFINNYKRLWNNFLLI